MIWKEMNKSIAQDIYNDKILADKNYVGDNDSDYQKIRNGILEAYKATLLELNIPNSDVSNNTKKYQFDTIFGIKLYKFLCSKEIGINMGIREASNDNIWIYIQINVVPEIIISRWGEENKQRMFGQPNRLYLKVLWWYIHLSLINNSLSETKKVLLNVSNSTDTIVQLVERTGQKGYRINLYRTIMKLKVKYELEKDDFRKLMKLNSARVKTIDPYLCKGGIEGYVESLIKEL